MAELTNKERLASIETSIKHIDGNIEKIATNNVSQWKVINKNAQDIASQKSIVKIIGGFVIATIVSIVSIFIGKYK